MPKNSEAGRMEHILRKEYGSNKHAIYGTLNKLGLMRGSRVTAKGKRRRKKRRTAIR